MVVVGGSIPLAPTNLSMTYVWSVLVVPDIDPSCDQSCDQIQSGIKKRTLLSSVRFSGVGV